MNRIVRMVILTGCLAFALPAYASNWMYVGSTVTNSHWYVDADTIRTSGYYRYVWLKIDLSEDTTRAETETKMYIKVNCFKRTRRWLSAVDYRADGSVSARETQPEYSGETGMDPIPPDSMADFMMSAVCA